MVIFSAFSIPHDTLRSGSILREGRTLSSRQTSSSCSPPLLATPSLNEPAKIYMMTEEQRNVIDTHHIFKYTSVFVIMFRVYQEKCKQIINALISRRLLSFFQAGYGISERQQISKCWGLLHDSSGKLLGSPGETWVKLQRKHFRDNQSITKFIEISQKPVVPPSYCTPLHLIIDGQL